MQLLRSQLPYEGLTVDLLLGADCSPELCCYHNSHTCIALSNTQSICRESLARSSVRHIPNLSWIVVDLPCFSEVDPLPAGMLSCFFVVVVVQTFINLLALCMYQILFRFLQGLLIRLINFYVFFCFFFFTSPLLQIPPLTLEVENTSGYPGFFFQRCPFLSITLAVSVTAVL